MNEIYANAYQEVIEVLKYTKKKDLIKIPKFKIDMYKKYMNKNNGFKIDKTKSLEEQDISNEAKAILANLYKDYWATDYEKRRIEAKENYDLEQIAKEKYSADNLFRKREVKTETISHNENSMIVTQKEKWYRRILNSIKNFFSKKNNNKLSVEEINQIEKQKSDGKTYAKMFDEDYSKMTKEEKEQTNRFMKELEEKIGFDDKFEISFGEKIKIAKSIYMKLGAKIEDFKISNIEGINADFFLPITSSRGLGGVIIANDGTYLLCGSLHPESYYIEEFRKGKRDNLEINRLQQLIEENSGSDPFWRECLNNYFKNVNKTEKEKVDFLSNLSNNKNLFNEFTKEIVNPINVDEIFEKYKTLSINNYNFFKQNDTDLIWWVDNHEQKGKRLFSFDRKKVYSLFKDYPNNLTTEEKDIFDRENPYWRDFFKKRVNNTNLQISYEEYKRTFEKDEKGCFINLIIPGDEQNEELNLIGKNPSEFSIDEIVRMKKYSEQLYKKVDKSTINDNPNISN